MDDTELDHCAEINRLLTGPLDALRERIACVTDGHIQPVVIDYVGSFMLMRYCEGPGHPESACYQSLIRLGASAQSRFRSSRHADEDDRVIYYAVAVPGSPQYRHPWVIYMSYARPETQPWFAGDGWPRTQLDPELQKLVSRTPAGRFMVLE